VWASVEPGQLSVSFGSVISSRTTSSIWNTTKDVKHGSDRRAFLAVTLALAGSGRVAFQAGRERSKTRLILLGTAGGPRPRKSRSASAQVVIANDTSYVLDCGDGVARQLVLAGIPLARVRHIFITHHHSDHNADYGNLLWLAWAAGLRTRVDSWGPPPLERMTQLFLEMDAADIHAHDRRTPSSAGAPGSRSRAEERRPGDAG
jgi:hypothetical protein